MYIHAKKDLEAVRYELPFLVNEEDILLIISKWSNNWLTPTIGDLEKVDTIGVRFLLMK